ncbi:MAG: hypothetical protein EOO36_10085 [Cytophagaceae bacterium]|nr:MAG: hypothetical protein EOO36_10085 [Cytophagaceae bacterium]
MGVLPVLTAHAQLAVGSTSAPTSTLQVVGSLAANYTSVTATTYTMQATDFYVAYSGTANTTFTLPTGVSIKGRLYTIKNVSAYTVTINTTSSQTIDGNASGVISIPAGQALQLITTGSTGTATYEILSFSSATKSGTLATASNGLTAAAGNVKLGGTLTAATNVATAGNALTFSGTGPVAIGTTTTLGVLNISGSMPTTTSSGGGLYTGGVNITNTAAISGNTSAQTLSIVPGMADATGITAGSMALYDLPGVGNHIFSDNVVPNGSNVNTLGSSDNQWATIYGVDGNFSGTLTLTGTGGSRTGAFAYYAYSTNNNTTNTGVSSGRGTGVSLLSTGSIYATQFNAFSDARLKNVRGLSNSRADLATVRRLEITDYTMKDNVQHQGKAFKKVIAQQVEQVYPLAVAKSKGFIPAIYRVGAIQAGAGGQTSVQLAAAHHLRVGDRVRLIGERNGTVEATVLAVGDAQSFSVALPAPETKLFVFGPEVSDLRTVDYEALAMLNVSATQELARQVEALAGQNAQLTSENASLNARLADKASASSLSEVQAALQALRAEMQTLRAAGTTASAK